MRKIFVLSVSTILTALSLLAQETPGLARFKGKSSITVKLDGLNCSTASGSDTFEISSWSFGATQPASTASGGGGGAGKAEISDLIAQKMFDACSPKLFGGVVTGKHFKTLTLNQDDRSQNPVMKIVLTDVLVSGFQLSSADSKEAPMESVSFNFTKICITDANSSNQLCFDRTTNSTQ
jgi:type VI secretion system secreted protein Hcp